MISPFHLSLLQATQLTVCESVCVVHVYCVCVCILCMYVYSVCAVCVYCVCVLCVYTVYVCVCVKKVCKDQS